MIQQTMMKSTDPRILAENLELIVICRGNGDDGVYVEAVYVPANTVESDISDAMNTYCKSDEYREQSSDDAIVDHLIKIGLVIAHAECSYIRTNGAEDIIN